MYRGTFQEPGSTAVATRFDRYEIQGEVLTVPNHLMDVYQAVYTRDAEFLQFNPPTRYLARRLLPFYLRTNVPTEHLPEFGRGLTSVNLASRVFVEQKRAARTRCSFHDSALLRHLLLPLYDGDIYTVATDESIIRIADPHDMNMMCQWGDVMEPCGLR